MLALPVALPVPETDTEVVTLEVPVPTVAVPPADCAIALCAANITPSIMQAAIGREIFIGSLPCMVQPQQFWRHFEDLWPTLSLI
jgi:hypothetical protein